jgi:hypothetical protein
MIVSPFFTRKKFKNKNIPFVVAFDALDEKKVQKKEYISELKRNQRKLNILFY